MSEEKPYQYVEHDRLTVEDNSSKPKITLHKLVTLALVAVLIPLLVFVITQQLSQPQYFSYTNLGKTSSHSAQASSMDTSSWKTYTNAENKYSIKYPSDQFVRLNCPNEGLDLTPRTASNTNTNENVLLPTCGRDGRFDIEVQAYDTSPQIPADGKDYSVKRSVITVAGIDSDRYIIKVKPECKGFCGPEWIEEVVLFSDKKYYVFYSTKENNQEIFDTMLSTFKFN